MPEEQPNQQPSNRYIDGFRPPNPVSTSPIPTEQANQTYTDTLPNEINLDDDIDDLFPMQPAQVVQRPMQASEPQLSKKQTRVPRVIYIVIVLDLILFIISFFNSSNTRWIYIGLTAINLALAISLILKKEKARQALIYFAGLTSIVAVALVTIFYLQYSSINKTFQKNYNEIKSATAQILTVQQKQQLASNQASTIAKRDKLANASKLFYIYSGVLIVENVIVVIYLSRDRVGDSLNTPIAKTQI